MNMVYSSDSWGYPLLPSCKPCPQQETTTTAFLSYRIICRVTDDEVLPTITYCMCCFNNLNAPWTGSVMRFKLNLFCKTGPCGPHITIKKVRWVRFTFKTLSLKPLCAFIPLWSGRQAGFHGVEGVHWMNGGTIREPPLSSSGSPKREKHTDKKTVTQSSFATICHHYSPHCVHKDRVPSHSEPLALICGRVHVCAHIKTLAYHWLL